MPLTVVYGSRRLKIPVEAGTLLGQIREQACASLGLEPEEVYALEHQRKPVDLTLPFRLSGLVNNAQLELVKSEKAQLSAAHSPLRVKIKIPGRPDFVGTFPGSTTIKDLLQGQNLDGDLLLNGTVLSQNRSLSAIGGSGLMFVFKPHAGAQSPTNIAQNQARIATDQGSNAPGNSRARETDRNTGQNIDHNADHNADHNIDHNIDHNADQNAHRDVRMTSSQGITHSQGIIAHDEPPDSPDQTQFLAYYNQLKSQAAPPMISKSTKEALAASRKTAIENTVCRIKFPDETHLEGKFRAGETGEDVFKFLSMFLQDPNQKYELVSIRPSFVLTKDMFLATQLGQRAMLLYRPLGTAQSPYLNERARRLMPAPAATPQTSSVDSAPKPAPPPKEDSSAGPKKKKGIPKWLKLHKK